MPQTGTAHSVLDPSPGFGPVLPPVCREARITGSPGLTDGALLPLEGASRSGPFYHLTGIAGED